MITDSFYNVVMQPTTLCNADCDYCYLPHRAKNMQMSVEVSQAVADSIKEQDFDYPISVVWHGGEPMATGVNHFQSLIDCFEELRLAGRAQHHIQTNGTLINESWCELIRRHDINVGVSLDGPAWANAQRVDWNNRPIFDYVIRGINMLKSHDIPFSIISVVKADTIARADELYEFFCDLGCSRWNINIEEVEGVNDGTEQYLDDDKVTVFWRKIFNAWKNNPVLPIRELNYVLGYANAVINEEDSIPEDQPLQVDTFPTIAFNGDVVLLSPEFAGIESDIYGNFVAGNVIKQSLVSISKASEDLNYVAEFEQALKMCSDQCPFFGFCAGGQASNRYFEHGTIAVTETAYCRNSRQRLLTAVIESL